MIFYDRSGQPIPQDEWVRLLENPGYRHLAVEDVTRPDGSVVVVSTVWLGIDHGYLPGTPPIIFETMVFATSPDDRIDFDGLFADRYTTEAEAVAGHRCTADRFKELA